MPPDKLKKLRKDEKNGGEKLTKICLKKNIEKKLKKIEKNVEKKLRIGWEKVETLPEAQRTQGIESMTWIIFPTKIDLKVFQMKKFIQVLNSIPWVRCASNNV